MILTQEERDNFLAHYGTLRKSGRYPWGSGSDQSKRNRTFLDVVAQHRKDGMTDVEIVKYYELGSTTKLRALQSIASGQQKREARQTAEKLKTKGMGYTAIGKQMGISESSVRSLLDPLRKENQDIVLTTADMLRRQVDEKKFIDVGAGVENKLGITKTRLDTSIEALKEEGYMVHPVQVPQPANSSQKTTVRVLCPPGTTYRDAKANRDNIRQIDEFSEDGGRSMLGLHPPLNVDSKRIRVVYAEDGGKDADGMIYVRPGVPDVSLGKTPYAQVRIAVDGSHYLKGMAVYKDDLPKGVDLEFHTNKSNTGNKLDAMKKMEKVKDDNGKDTDKIDMDNPFGSNVRQMVVRGPDGKERVTSAMNKVGLKEGSGEEGAWDSWSRNLSSQMLSKQSPKLAEQQLGKTRENAKAELAAIKALTNPVVRRELLMKFADGADSSAVHMEAALLPRQSIHVILPVKSLKPNEVYAPNYRPGEVVALVRYPHGGPFEIPELVVNNNHPPAIKMIGERAKDAIGIHPSVAERLSGADFDGDFVVVIPNNNKQIKTAPALAGLKDFDAKTEYRLPKDAPDSLRMTSSGTGLHMGMVSNLITDMTIKGASPEELTRAVKHSMVVIDAEKHGLDYKRSAREHSILALKQRYQQQPDGRFGAATLISRATSEDRHVPDHHLRRPKDGGPIDPRTGKLVYEKDPKHYINGRGEKVTIYKKAERLSLTDDARTLISDKNTKIEHVYADHSNNMKALANEARKEVAAFKPPRQNESAKKAYAKEVQSLNAKLSLARQNKPLERQAQIFAAAAVSQKKAANPNLTKKQEQKIQAQALNAARLRLKAEKVKIQPTPQEWAAIQAGAISHSRLSEILKNADLASIRELATPRTQVVMSASKTARARDMARSGHTQADIADALGVSVSSVKEALNG